jgi:hypothetical protein
MIRRPTRALVAAFAITVALLATSVPTAAAADMVGTFTFTPGKSKVVKVRGKKKVRVTGTYFRMLLSGKSGKSRKDYFVNPNSRSRDKTYTLMRPGIDGGLKTGQYQNMPVPDFDLDGSSLANRIMKTERFTDIRFGLSTDPVDKQSDVAVPAPVVRRTGRRLSGDLRAFTASWNRQYFNQGSPKPNGSRPGGTRRVTGTYNPKTRRYTLTWKSLIIGGPFGGFVGSWHLTGKFKPAS